MHQQRIASNRVAESSRGPPLVTFSLPSVPLPFRPVDRGGVLVQSCLLPKKCANFSKNHIRTALWLGNMVMT